MRDQRRRHNQMKAMFLADLVNDLSDKEPSDHEDPEPTAGARCSWMAQ